MPRYCAVKLCKNRGGVLSKDNKRISFYPFPLRDQARLQQWVDNMRRAAWMPSRHQYLCSEHFTEDSFDLRWGIRYLKHTAVPTIFPYICEDEGGQLRAKRSPKERRGRAADSSDIQEALTSSPPPPVFTSSSPPPPKRSLLLLKRSDLNNNNRRSSSSSSEVCRGDRGDIGDVCRGDVGEVCRGDVGEVCRLLSVGAGGDGDNRVFSLLLVGHLQPTPEHHGKTLTETEPRPSQQHAAPSLVDASSIEPCDRLALGSRGGPEETAVAALPCETQPLHPHTFELAPTRTLHAHTHTHTSELPVMEDSLHSAPLGPLLSENGEEHSDTGLSGEGHSDTGLSGEGHSDTGLSGLELRQTSASGGVPAEVTGAGGLVEEEVTKEEVEKEVKEEEVEEEEARRDTEDNSSYLWTRLNVCVSGPVTEGEEEEKKEVKETREEVEEVKRPEAGDGDSGASLWSVCDHSYAPVTEEEEEEEEEEEVVVKKAREVQEVEVKRQEVAREAVECGGAHMWSACEQQEEEREEVKRRRAGDGDGDVECGGASFWSVCEHSYARVDLDEQQLWRRVASLHAKMAALQRREDETLGRIRSAESTLTTLRKQHIVTQERQRTLETHFTAVYLQ